MAEQGFTLARTVLSVLFLGVLIGASLWVLRPFLGPIIWATMIVVATWRLMLAFQQRLYGRRSLAVLMMVLTMLLVFVVPLALAIETLVSNAGTLKNWADAVATLNMPTVPRWLAALPWIGDDIARGWEQMRTLSAGALAQRAAPYAAALVRWFLAQVSGVGLLFVQFLLTVLIAALMWARGERIVDVVLRFSARLAGERGVAVARLAGQAIRGVAYGIVLTALIQAILAGIGLAIAGVPFAALLTAAVFILTVAQLGPIFVLAPAVVWIFTSGNTGWGIFLLIWTLFVVTMDNFLRPWLIKRGADLPLLLIFAGVVGGLIAFGVIGIFVGPVVLAVSWTLLRAWIDESDTAPAPATGGG
jgi:predicted PurR-regulated permease PerM